MPGPVIGGKIIDSCCLMWRSSCLGEGACALYSNEDFRFRRHIVDITAKVIIVVLFVILVILARRKTDWSTQMPEYADDSDDDDNVDDPFISQKPSLTWK